ncbi:MAG: hypothetical protein IT381_03530 [Deltaproteobacteria bacterium]|nr:hypothetical protein [Deltaproteobacteria bacterium]
MTETDDGGDDVDTETPSTNAGSTTGGCDTRTATAASACTAAFQPDSGTETFDRPTTRFFTVLQGSANHRGIDTIVNPGDEQILIGKFAYGPFDADLVHEKVEVWIERQCGAWSKIGTTWTSDDGDYPTTNGVSDTGGRVFFRVPVAAALPAGDFRVKMLVKGDHSEANFWLHVWPKGTRAVVSDIDGTMTTQETDGAWSWLDANSPLAQTGAPELMQAYFAKGYRIINLTARPERLTNGTRQWFLDNGFPRGTFHLAQSNIGELGSAAYEYKRAYLDELVNDKGVLFDAAIGNKDTDLNAYLDAGIDPARITLIEGEYDGDLMGATRVADYLAAAQNVGCLAPIRP